MRVDVLIAHSVWMFSVDIVNCWVCWMVVWCTEFMLLKFDSVCCWRVLMIMMCVDALMVCFLCSDSVCCVVSVCWYCVWLVCCSSCQYCWDLSVQFSTLNTRFCWPLDPCGKNSTQERWKLPVQMCCFTAFLSWFTKIYTLLKLNTKYIKWLTFLPFGSDTVKKNSKILLFCGNHCKQSIQRNVWRRNNKCGCTDFFLAQTAFMQLIHVRHVQDCQEGHRK